MSSFEERAKAAAGRGAADEHGTSRIEFADGTYATFVEGKTWALWDADDHDGAAGQAVATTAGEA